MTVFLFVFINVFDIRCVFVPLCEFFFDFWLLDYRSATHRWPTTVILLLICVICEIYGQMLLTFNKTIKEQARAACALN